MDALSVILSAANGSPIYTTMGIRAAERSSAAATATDLPRSHKPDKRPFSPVSIISIYEKTIRPPLVQIVCKSNKYPEDYGMIPEIISVKKYKECGICKMVSLKC